MKGKPFLAEEEKVFVSDLRTSGCNTAHLVLMRPESMEGIQKEELANLDAGRFRKTFNEIMKFQNLLHLGTLVFDYSSLAGPEWSGGRVYRFHSCGRKLTFCSPDEAKLSEKLKNWVRTGLTCACGVKLGSGIEKSDLKNLLLHLTLKSIRPMLDTCNVVDCSKAWREKSRNNILTRNNLLTVRSLGIVAFSVDQHYRFKGEIKCLEKSVMNQEWIDFSLGLSLFPRISVKGLPELSTLADYLHAEKEKCVNSAINLLRRCVLGPKSL